MIYLIEDMNLAQEIFLLFFAISYGIMIANLPKGSFPTETACTRKELEKIEYEKEKFVYEWIDKNKFWNISKKRLSVSFIFFNIVVILFFCWVFVLLSSYIIEPDKFLSWNGGKILLLAWLGLATHGFYRFYFAILLKFKYHLVEINLRDEWKKEGKYLESPFNHALGSIHCFIPVFILVWYMTGLFYAIISFLIWFAMCLILDP